MRSKSLPDMLLYEATRKPAIAELVARVHEMSDAEIESAPVPFPWYRKALKEMRSLKGDVNFTAYVLENTVAGYVADAYGEIREWTGDMTFINLDRGQLELRTGKLFFFPDTGGVWFETLFSRLIDPRLRNMPRIALGSKTSYTHMHRAKTNGLSVPSAPSQNLSPSGRELPYGIRISRIS